MTKNINGDIYSDLITSTNPNVMNSTSDRRPIDLIIVHHNATTNKDIAMNTWIQGGPANSSAHYEITDDEIIGCVGENYTAWQAGEWNANLRSIGLEHLNSTGAPSWQVSDATLRNSARLIADICKRYGLPINSDTIKPHRYFVPTACPGGLDVDKLINLAIEYSGAAPAPAPAPQAAPATSSNAIQQFKNAGNKYTVSASFKVDNVANVDGLWQVMSSDLLGGTMDGANWSNNGIPLDTITFTNNDGSLHPNQTWDGTQPRFVINGEYNHGTIDYYDEATNAVGIVWGSFGTIWFNADSWLKA